MPQITELISGLAEKLGVSKDDEKLKSFLANKSLEGVVIDDSLGTLFNTKLIPIDAAKDHPDIFNTNKAKLYGSVDEVLNAMEDLDIDEPAKIQIRAALASEKSTPKKALLLAREIQKLEKAKASAGLKGDKKEYQDEIDRLQDKLAQELSSKKEAIEAKDREIANLQLGYLLDSELVGYNFAFPEGMPMKVKLQTVKAVINDELRKQGATLTEENGVLALKKMDGTEFRTDSHQKVNYKQFIDGVLAQNNLLAATKGDGGTGNKNGSGKIIAAGDTTVDNTRYKLKAEQRLKEFEQGSQVVGVEE